MWVEPDGGTRRTIGIADCCCNRTEIYTQTMPSERLHFKKHRGVFCRRVPSPTPPNPIVSINTIHRKPTRYGVGNAWYALRRSQPNEILTENQSGRATRPLRCPLKYRSAGTVFHACPPIHRETRTTKGRPYRTIKSVWNPMRSRQAMTLSGDVEDAVPYDSLFTVRSTHRNGEIYGRGCTFLRGCAIMTVDWIFMRLDADGKGEGCR